MSEYEMTAGRFLVRVVGPGGDLEGGRRNDAQEPLVEFLDTANAHPEYSPRGQFVSRYYLSTLLGHTRGVGLDLHCGVPAWKVPAEDMATILDWARRLVTTPRRAGSLADSFARRRRLAACEVAA